MNLVCERYAQNIRVGLPQVREIGFLSLLPMRFTLPFRSIGETIRARLNNPSYPLAESVADILKPGLAALIFNAIVQERRNGEVLVTAIL
jgi:hypothetical protein